MVCIEVVVIITTSDLGGLLPAQSKLIRLIFHNWVEHSSKSKQRFQATSGYAILWTTSKLSFIKTVA